MIQKIGDPLTFTFEQKFQIMQNDEIFNNVKSHVLESREKAFVYAISTAGVAYSVTKACSKGDIVDCGCDERIRNKETKGKWEWGGCSDDIRFGSAFTKEFIDSMENVSTPQGLMNLHNNEAGRRVKKHCFYLLNAPQLI